MVPPAPRCFFFPPPPLLLVLPLSLPLPFRVDFACGLDFWILEAEASPSASAVGFLFAVLLLFELFSLFGFVTFDFLGRGGLNDVREGLEVVGAMAFVLEGRVRLGEFLVMCKEAQYCLAGSPDQTKISQGRSVCLG